MRNPIAVFTALLLCIASVSAQQSMVLSASKDNTLYQSSGGTLSNGAGDAVFAGTNAGTFSPLTVRRGLMAFDVAGSIPAGSTITSVQLNLTLIASPSGSTPCALHPVLADWGEAGSVGSIGGGGGGPAQPGDATWLHTFTPGSLWASPGGDFNPTSSATVSVPGNIGSVVTWGSTAQMVADVQSWLDTPVTNFGWMFRGPESGSSSVKKFGSRENMFFPPNLVVNYTAPPVGATLGIGANATTGSPLTISLQSPAAAAPCYVFASTQTANYAIGTVGSTTYFSHLLLSDPSLLSLADPTNTFGPSLTNPVTDGNGDWSLTLVVPNNPSLVGLTYYSEGYVQDPGLLPNGLFWQTNLLTVTIQ